MPVDVTVNQLDVHSGLLITRQGNTSVTIRLQNGIFMDVDLDSGVLQITPNVPLEFQNRYSTRGLYGNYDNDPTNDFQQPDGTILPSKMVYQEIHSYGEKWRTRANESIFTYRAGFSHEDYQNIQYVPQFLDNVTDSAREEATSVCKSTSQLSCVFDFIVTRNEKLAQHSLLVEDQTEKEFKRRKNHVPRILSTNRLLLAEVGQPVSINIAVLDVDGNSMTVHIRGLGDIVTYEGAGEVTVEHTWTPLDTNPVNVSVYAKDSIGGSSAMWPLKVLLCPTCVHGTCDYAIGKQGAMFSLVPCICDIGWTGASCNKDNDGCRSKPCVNDKCTDLSPAEELQSGHAFICNCGAGYQMSLETNKCLDIDECTEGHQCDQICTNILGSYNCSCQSGFRLVGDHQCVDINECREGRSKCQQVCVNTVGSYQCDCMDGSSLAENGHNCVLHASLRNACDELECEQDCYGNSSTEMACVCCLGYQLNADGHTCKDMDECLDPHQCSHLCTNTDGSFFCSCYSGYTLSADGVTCQECQPGTWGPNCTHLCSDCSRNTAICDPVHGCMCQAGWEGPRCEVNTDECSSQPSVCGDALHVCRDTEGSYICECPSGYEESADRSCVNINECMSGGANNCFADFVECMDLSPGYACHCRKGYIGDRYKCENIDECMSGTSGCQQVCIDTQGAYNCECHPGYLLDDDRHACLLAKDPCASTSISSEDCMLKGSHGCRLSPDGDPECFCNRGYLMTETGHCQANRSCDEASECSDVCLDVPGGFTCACNPGRSLLKDGITCQACNASGHWGPDCNNKCDCSPASLYCDSFIGCVCPSGLTGRYCETDINECDSSPCNGNLICVNRPGTYICTCNQGYQLKDGQCEDVDECLSDWNICSQRCINTQGSYSCACHLGFEMAEDPGRCTNIDECNTGSDDCDQLCMDTPGSFLCGCWPDYTLAEDLTTCIRDNFTADLCANQTNQCDYGCKVDNGQPVCFCPAHQYLDPSDNQTCHALVSMLEATIDLDLQYSNQYVSKSNQEFKDMASDLRSALMLVYRGIPEFIDVQIVSIQPEFSVTHNLLLATENISTALVSEIATQLKFTRDQIGYLWVGTEVTNIISEPTIKIPGTNVSMYVTCLLCDVVSHCILVDSTRKGLTCSIPREENKSIAVTLVLQRDYDVLYSEALSVQYAVLANAVKAALENLFEMLQDYAGVGEILFRPGPFQSSIMAETYVRFNHTVQADTFSVVGQALAAHQHRNGCLVVNNMCIIILGPISAENKPAVCWTCASTDVCYSEHLDHHGYPVYSCHRVDLPADGKIKVSDKTDLMLGLALGIPMSFLFIAMVVSSVYFGLKTRAKHATVYYGYTDNSNRGHSYGGGYVKRPNRC